MADVKVREVTHHGKFYNVREFDADDAETFRAEFVQCPYTYKPEKADAVWARLIDGADHADHGWTRWSLVPCAYCGQEIVPSTYGVCPARSGEQCNATFQNDDANHEEALRMPGQRYEFGSNVPGYLPEAEFPAVYADWDAAKADCIRQMREDADAAGGPSNIDHHPSGVSYCNDCSTRLVLMADDCGCVDDWQEGADPDCDMCSGSGAIEDRHACREDYAEALTAAAEEVNLWSPSDQEQSVTVCDPSRAHDLGRAYWVRPATEAEYRASEEFWS